MPVPVPRPTPRVHVISEVVELIATSRSEPDSDPSIEIQVAAQSGKHLPTCAWSEERHYVPRAHDRVESLLDSLRWKVELGKITDQPRRTRMIFFSGGDEVRITVDADDCVTGVGQERTHPTGSTAGI